MSDQRTKALLSIRPQIDLTERSTQSEFEYFQNNTLRQICKFQNILLLDFIETYIQAKNKNFTRHAVEDKLKYIDSLFAKDTHFKNILKGIIIGQFTSEEFQFYSSHISEINKRIIQLVKTRFLSQFKH